MAAGEDQAETIIFDLIFVRIRTEGSCVAARFDVGNEIFLCSVQPSAPAYSVYGFEACCGNQPGTRLVGNTSLGPGLQSDGECLMHGLFGEIQISEKAQKRCQNPARFGSVKSLNDGGNLFRHRRRHLRQASKQKRRGTTALGLPCPKLRGPQLLSHINPYSHETCPSSSRCVSVS